MNILTMPVMADDHSQGNAGAKCTGVEYGDFPCPACGQAAPIVKDLQKRFGIDLRFVFRHNLSQDELREALHAEMHQSWVKEGWSSQNDRRKANFRATTLVFATTPVSLTVLAKMRRIIPVMIGFLPVEISLRSLKLLTC